MRTVRRLRLRCFSFNIYSDVLSTLLLVALSKLCRPIISIQFGILCTGIWYPSRLYAYGGPGGIRTPVQNTFLFASYSNNLLTLPSVLLKTGSSSFIHTTCFWFASTLASSFTDSVIFCITTRLCHINSLYYIL